MEAFFSAIGAILFLTISFGFYFIPTIVAVMRDHDNMAPIIIINAFLGVTGVGWVIALAWAFTNQSS